MAITDLLVRVRGALAEALLPRSIPGTPEQVSDALQEVTRWAWLPALSGVAVAADRARRDHENCR